jgi:hypothetical protein
VGLRAVLNTATKKQMPRPCGELNHDFSGFLALRVVTVRT